MTPPDAMSWDEAVRGIDAAAAMLDWDGYETASRKLSRALAAIQSHRVQAEADAVDAARYRRMRHMNYLHEVDTCNVKKGSSMQDVYANFDASLDAALAAAANNDGGGK